MAQDYARRFYSSKAWQKTRAAYLKYAGGLCERCFTKGIITPGVIVHHIKPITPENINDPTITLSFDNLELVCRECHADEHDELYAMRRNRRYVVEKNGSVRTI